MTAAGSLLREALAGMNDAIRSCDPGSPDNLTLLRDALERLGGAAGESEQLGLQDCIMLLQQQLDDITDTGGLSELQLQQLSEWPALLEAYLSERNHANTNALLAILQNDCWPTPLTENDAGILRDTLSEPAEPDTQGRTATLKEAMADLYAALAGLETESPASLEPVIRQLETFAQAAADAGQQALQDTALLLQQNLTDVSATDHGLTDPQRTLLVAWLNLARKYLVTPGDANLAHALVQNLQSPNWPSPLTQQDTDIFYELFGVAPPEPEAQDDASADVSQPDTTPPAVMDLLTAVQAATADDVDAVRNLAGNLDDVAQAAGDRDLLGLQDVCLLLQQQLEDIAALDKGLNDEQLLRLQQWAQHARSYFLDPADTACARALLDDLEAGCWPASIDESDIVILREMLSGEATPASEATTATATDQQTPIQQPSVIETPDTSQMPPPEPRAVSRELVEMLAAEIVQMQQDASALLAQIEAPDSTPALRGDALAQYVVRVERFGNASQAAELSGLQQASEVFQRNINLLAQQEAPLTQSQIDYLQQWPVLVDTYLQNPGDQQASHALTRLLLDPAWPDPLLPELGDPLTDLLAAAYITESVDREERIRTATAEHVSLELPADINQELLDGLLQELPGQMESFSEAIQALASGQGSNQDLQRAQRVAHTIKGAANTVGVRGIATMTHQIEDLLVILVEHDRLPSRALAEVLVEAADCLEEMCEALLEQGQPPAGSTQTLQAVLDWVNRIEQQGVDVIESDLAPAGEGAAAATGAQAEQADEEQAQATMLRVPASLVDDLLRLVGETVILTAQLQEHVRNTTSQNESLLNQHDLLQQLVGELEQQVDVRGVAFRPGLIHSGAAADDTGFDTLELEQYNELHTVTHRLIEAAADSIELNQDIGQHMRNLDELLINQSRLHREVQELVMRTRMVPIKTIVPRLQRAVRQTCRVTGKQVEFSLHGTDTLIDSDILNSLVDPMMHILRNAVDHGIESREERIRKNKSPAGSITLECYREGVQIVIRCRDDGGGLDLAAIRQLAEQRGLIDPGTDLPEEELKRLILRPGFSTRKETTQTSGRGIGMDIVATQLQNIKGSILIDSETGGGTQFELRLPVTLMTTHGLLVRVRRQVMAISTRGIEQILHPSDGEIIDKEDGESYRLEGESMDFHRLDDLLCLPRDRRGEQRQTKPALLVREEALNCAVQIEQVIDSRDLVVKPLGPYLQNIRGIVGATILGDGSVVPVLDLPELIRTPLTAAAGPGEFTDTGIRRSLPVALIVDDSISARRSMAQVVRDAGYEVRTAKDGLEAAGLIEKRCPDILLTDLEMPRMNGIELASHVRGNPDSASMPVIMITSRSTEKHREMAESAGVDVYLTKPFSEDQLLQHVHDLLEQVYSVTV